MQHKSVEHESFGPSSFLPGDALAFGTLNERIVGQNPIMHRRDSRGFELIYLFSPLFVKQKL